MTQFTKLAWVLTGLIVLTSGACSSDVTPTPPGVTEDVSLSSIALRVERDDLRHLPPGRAPGSDGTRRSRVSPRLV